MSQNVIPAPVLPRSVLHSLEPIGLGTAQVESLASYFCRLANSHACTTNDLTQLVIDKVAPGRWNTYQAGDGKSRFVWHERAVSGVGEGALTWTSVLSELTGVAGLDRLTLLPLRSVLAPKALMAQRARWCPHCLDEDQKCGRAPYLRLAWDVGINKVCANHGVPLISECCHCGLSNVRNNANFVVPGWCTACDHFLGCAEHHGPRRLLAGEEAVQLQQAQEIGELLAASSSDSHFGFQPDLNGVHDAIESLIEEMDGSVCAYFAKRIGVRKSTIHYWKSARSALTLDALTRVSIHCNLSLPELVQGSLAKWTAPSLQRQMSLSLDYPANPCHSKHKQRDWGAIRDFLNKELASPIVRSLAEVAEDLDIDDRHLYIRVTDEARMVGERYVQYLHEIAREREALYLAVLQETAREIHDEGEPVTVEAVTQVLGKPMVNSFRGLYSTLSQINSDLDAANDNL